MKLEAMAKIVFKNFRYGHSDNLQAGWMNERVKPSFNTSTPFISKEKEKTRLDIEWL